MGATQIMYQQEDPTAKMIADAGDSITQTIQREQAMQLTARYYKTMQQNADTEQMKAHWQRKADFTKALIDIKRNLGNNPQAAAIALKDQMDGLHGGDQQQGFQDLAQIGKDSDERYQQLAGAMAPQAGEVTPAQAQGAQANEANATAQVNAIKADQMRNPQKYIQMMQQAQQGSQQTGQQLGGQAQQPQVQDMANAPPMMSNYDMDMGNMRVGFTNPAAKYREAMAGVAGSEYGQKQMALAPYKQNLKDLKASLNQAIQEQGGPAASEVEAGIKGFGGKFLGEVKPNSSIAGFDDSLNTLANSLTSDINRGRPNTVELQGVKEGMPNRYHSAVTNAILFRRLENMGTLPGDKPMDWAMMLNQSRMIGQGDDQITQQLKNQGWSDARINAQLRRYHQKMGDL